MELDSSRISLLIDLATKSRDPESRALAASQFSAAIRIGFLDLQKYPDNLASLIAMYDSLPRELQIALHSTSSSIRASLPDDLDKLVSDPNEALASDLTQYNYYFAMAADPGRHARLGRYFAEGLLPPLAFDLARVYLDRHGGFTDKDFGDALAGIVGNPDMESLHQGAWNLLALGPSDAKANALSKMMGYYRSRPEGTERMKVARQAKVIGREATPVFLDLLRGETSPVARVELAASIVSRVDNQTDPEVASALRAVFGKEIDCLLGGRDPLGMQYVMVQLDGVKHGVDRYAGLVRDLYSTYGSIAREGEIRSFADRIFIPEYVVKNDEESAVYIRDAVRDIVSQSIDEIHGYEAH